MYLPLQASKQSLVWKLVKIKMCGRDINSEYYYADTAVTFQNINKILTSVFSSGKELRRLSQELTLTGA